MAYFKDKSAIVESAEGERVRLTGRVKFARCGCGCVWCPKCGVRSGLVLRDDLVKEFRSMGCPYFITISPDRALFKSAQQCHDHFAHRRIIGELVKELRRLRYLNHPRYFCVLEFQTETGEGWPHWHLVVDAAFVPIWELRKIVARLIWDRSWGKMPPVEKHSRAVGASVVFRVKSKQEVPKLVRYISGYLTKSPKRTDRFPDGWPSWVVDGSRQLHRWSASRDFFIVTGKRRERREHNFRELRLKYGPDGSEHWEQAPELELKPPRCNQTVRQRIAGCGQMTVVMREIVKVDPLSRRHETFWQYVGTVKSNMWSTPHEVFNGQRVWPKVCDESQSSFVAFGRSVPEMMEVLLPGWDRDGELLRDQDDEDNGGVPAGPGVPRMRAPGDGLMRYVSLVSG